MVFRVRSVHSACCVYLFLMCMVCVRDWAFLCVRMCVGLHVCICRCCEGLQLTSKCFLHHSPPHTWRQGLSPSLELIDYSVSLLQGFPVSTSLKLQLQVGGQHPPPSFYVSSGPPTLVLILVRHLPSPKGDILKWCFITGKGFPVQPD